MYYFLYSPLDEDLIVYINIHIYNPHIYTYIYIHTYVVSLIMCVIMFYKVHTNTELVNAESLP